MELVARGGDCLVFRISDREVLKQPQEWPDERDREDTRENFEREIEFFKSLQKYGKNPHHPHLVNCTDLTFTNGIRLEFLSGGNLETRLSETSQIALTEKVRWLEGLSAAVNFITSIGFAHGDLRPANVLLDHSGNVKLCDFGATVKIGGEKYALHVPFWDGDSEVADHKSEQFALASCLFTIIVEAEPYAEIEETNRVNETIDLFRKYKFPRTNGRLGLFHLFHPIISKSWHRKYESMTAMHGDILNACYTTRVNSDLGGKLEGSG